MQRWVGPALAGLVMVGAVTLWTQRDGAIGSPAPLPDHGAAVAPLAAASASPPSLTPAANGPAPSAPSWQGTEVDGDIHLDARGNLIPDRALRDLFDYLLTARGELSLEQIRQRLSAVGHAHGLNAAQLEQLSSMFGRYLDYLDALPQVALQGTDVDSLRRTYEARRALRRGALGIEMAEGFFAEDEARDRYEIDTVAIRQDRSLKPDARASALAALRRSEAPPALREADQRSATVIDLAAETDRLRAAGADAAAIQALREREVGSEAAQRLADLDASRAQWQQRVDALRSARDAIMANQGLAPEDRQRQVDALIARDFTEPEALRLQAQLANPPAASGR
jgi:lipase chaperone LimK